MADLIDKEEGVWREDLIMRVMPIDADLVLRIPLCTSWPSDKLIWHYSANGMFSVRCAYHLVHSLKFTNLASSSKSRSKELWRLVHVPPRIRMFMWRVGASALPTSANMGRRIPNFSMTCTICGAMEESDVHILLQLSDGGGDLGWE